MGSLGGARADIFFFFRAVWKENVVLKCSLCKCSDLAEYVIGREEKECSVYMFYKVVSNS